MHVPLGWERKDLSLPLSLPTRKSVCGARATSVESGCGSGATRAAINRRSAHAHVEGRVRLARRAKFLPGRRGPSIMTPSLSEWTKYMSALTTDYLDLIERLPAGASL